jgi:hypothetical protein
MGQANSRVDRTAWGRADILVGWRYQLSQYPAYSGTLPSFHGW